MALSLDEKKAIVAEVSEIAASAHSAVAAEYIGIAASEMTDLHAKARAGEKIVIVIVCKATF